LRLGVKRKKVVILVDERGQKQKLSKKDKKRAGKHQLQGQKHRHQKERNADLQTNLRLNYESIIVRIVNSYLSVNIYNISE
jgi:hypothetical protein